VDVTGERSSYSTWPYPSTPSSNIVNTDVATTLN